MYEPINYLLRVPSSGNPAYNFTPVSGDGEEGGGELHLTGLKAYTRYTLVAQAVNQIGSGPLSEPLTTQTLEDGELSITCRIFIQFWLIKATVLIPRSVRGIILAENVDAIRYNDTKGPPRALSSLGGNTLYEIFATAGTATSYSPECLFPRLSTGTGNSLSRPRPFEPCSSSESVPGSSYQKATELDTVKSSLGNV